GPVALGGLLRHPALEYQLAAGLGHHRLQVAPHLVHGTGALARHDLPGPGAPLHFLEAFAGPERIHVEIALPRPVALVVALGHRQVGEPAGPARGGGERTLLDHHQPGARPGRGQLHPDVAVGQPQHGHAGAGVAVEVPAVDEAAADLLLQLRPVIDATPQRALEHLLRTGLRQHRLEVAAQFALGELLVAAAVARDRQHGVPARALDPVHAIAEPEREARVAAHV